MCSLRVCPGLELTFSLFPEANSASLAVIELSDENFFWSRKLIFVLEESLPLFPKGLCEFVRSFFHWEYVRSALFYPSCTSSLPKMIPYIPALVLCPQGEGLLIFNPRGSSDFTFNWDTQGQKYYKRDTTGVSEFTNLDDGKSDDDFHSLILVTDQSSTEKMILHLFIHKVKCPLGNNPQAIEMAKQEIRKKCEPLSQSAVIEKKASCCFLM